MTTRRSFLPARQGGVTLLMAALAACAVPAPRPAAPPPAPARPAPSAQATPDWRDVPLTPGDWTWRGGQGAVSIAQFGASGQGVRFALRCDRATRNIIFSRPGAVAPAAVMVFTTSFGVFTLAAGSASGQPPAIEARAAARDPRLDQLAFSRGRFLVDVAGQPRLVLPAWPEVARVIEDCRS